MSHKICYENIVNVAVFIIYRSHACASIRTPRLPYLQNLYFHWKLDSKQLKKNRVMLEPQFLP